MIEINSFSGRRKEQKEGDGGDVGWSDRLGRTTRGPDFSLGNEPTGATDAGSDESCRTSLESGASLGFKDTFYVKKAKAMTTRNARREGVERRGH